MSSSPAPTKKRKRLLVPREEIAWFPTIETSACNGCGDCVSFCRPGVFAFSVADTESSAVLRPKMLVANPYNCMVLCTRCEPVCPSGAITLPACKEFEKYVEIVDI